MPRKSPITRRIDRLVTKVERGAVFHEEGFKIDVGEALARLMHIDGTNQTALAARLGFSRAYMSRIMRGSENLSFRTLAKIAAALNCRWRLEFWRRGRKIL